MVRDVSATSEDGERGSVWSERSFRLFTMAGGDGILLFTEVVIRLKFVR